MVRATKISLLGLFLFLSSAQPSNAQSSLTEREQENLIAFTRLYGYVRFFHPSDEGATTNWNLLAVEGTEYVQDAADANELATRLHELFVPIAPTVQVFPTDIPPTTSPEMLPADGHASLQIARWVHQGVGIAPSDFYKSNREFNPAPNGTVFSFIRDPRVPLEKDLGGGVTARIPLSLFVDNQGTFPQSDITHPWTDSLAQTGPLRKGEEWASIAIAWNVFQHFYPYFDVVDTGWDAALPKAFLLNEERGHKTALRYLVAQLHDGHGGVYELAAYYRRVPDAPIAIYAMPLAWVWAENRLVITGAAPELPLSRGDIVTHLNGQPIDAVLREEESLISGSTPQWKRYQALRLLLQDELETITELTILGSDGASRIVPVAHTTTPLDLPEEPRPSAIAELQLGIFYVDLGRMTFASFEAAVPDLERADGIIFDFRKRPTGLSFSHVIGRFVDHALQSPQWHIPLVTSPDHENMQYTVSDWTLPRQTPRLSSNVAYIVDAQAISASETWLSFIEHYQLAEIVGEPTAGTNGNINPFTVPSGLLIHWTGMKVLRQDGSQHHGIGIQPTIPVTRTIAGIRAGRDEFLERAIEAVSSQLTDIENTEMPTSIHLSGNFPNPFSNQTHITFHLPHASYVTLDVYTILGEHVHQLVKAHLTAGTHQIPWTPSYEASGVYMYRLQAGSFSETRAMMFSR